MRCFLRMFVLSSIVLTLSGSAYAAPMAVDDEPIEVTGEKGKAETEVAFTLLNPDRERVSLEVELAAESGTGLTLSEVKPSRLPARTATRVTATLGGLDQLEKTVEAELVATAGETVVTQGLTAKPAPEGSGAWPEALVFGALGLGLLLMLAIVGWVFRKGKQDKLLLAAPGPSWSFDSWATTLTAAGAVLGTVLGSATLPEQPREIDKDTFVALNLVFGGMLVAGPFIFQALRRPKASASDQESGLWGTNVTLLFACGLTLAAVAGELGTLALLAWELGSGQAWEITAIVVPALLLAAAIYYFALTTWQLVTTDWPAEAKAEAKAAAKPMLVTIVPAEKKVVLRRPGIEDIEVAAGVEGSGDVVVPAVPATRLAWRLP